MSCLAICSKNSSNAIRHEPHGPTNAQGRSWSHRHSKCLKNLFLATLWIVIGVVTYIALRHFKGFNASMIGVAAWSGISLLGILSFYCQHKSNRNKAAPVVVPAARQPIPIPMPAPKPTKVEEPPAPQHAPMFSPAVRPLHNFGSPQREIEVKESAEFSAAEIEGAKAALETYSLANQTLDPNERKKPLEVLSKNQTAPINLIAWANIELAKIELERLGELSKLTQNESHTALNVVTHVALARNFWYRRDEWKRSLRLTPTLPDPFPKEAPITLLMTKVGVLIPQLRTYAHTDNALAYFFGVYLWLNYQTALHKNEHATANELKAELSDWFLRLLNRPSHLHIEYCYSSLKHLYLLADEEVSTAEEASANLNTLKSTLSIMDGIKGKVPEELLPKWNNLNKNLLLALANPKKHTLMKNSSFTTMAIDCLDKALNVFFDVPEYSNIERYSLLHAYFKLLKLKKDLFPVPAAFSSTLKKESTYFLKHKQQADDFIKNNWCAAEQERDKFVELFNTLSKVSV